MKEHRRDGTMEVLAKDALNIIDEKLAQFCKEGRDWVIRAESFKALKPLQKPESETLEEKLQNGILVIDKPPGPTSHEVVAYIKKMLGIRRAGHGGTLEGALLPEKPEGDRRSSCSLR